MFQKLEKQDEINKQYIDYPAVIENDLVNKPSISSTIGVKERSEKVIPLIKKDQNAESLGLFSAFSERSTQIFKEEGKEKNCDDIFGIYLSEIAVKVNRSFYSLLIKFLLLYRECVNKYGWYKKFQILGFEENKTLHSNYSPAADNGSGEGLELDMDVEEKSDKIMEISKGRGVDNGKMDNGVENEKREGVNKNVEHEEGDDETGVRKKKKKKNVLKELGITNTEGNEELERIDMSQVIRVRDQDINDMKQYEYCMFNGAEYLPDLSNEFILLYLEDLKYSLDKESAIDLTLNFCNWLYTNHYSSSQLSFVK